MKSLTPLVTVIIPTYNRWPSVCDAIDSVLSQTYKNIECLVVDDASQDDTKEQLISKYANSIIVVSNSENKGQSFGRNHGVKKAKGDYLCFLDSDDIFTEDAIQSRMSLYDNDLCFQGVSFGLCVSEEKGDTNNYLLQKKANESLSISEYIDNKGWIRNNSYIIPSQVMKRVGLYNDLLFNKEEIELFLRLLCQVEFRFSGSIVSLIREQSNNRARDNYERIIEQWDRFYRTIKNNPKVADKLNFRELIKLQIFDIMEPLRGLYKTRQYSEYRKAYRNTLNDKNLVLNRRFKRRYVFSYLRQFFKF